MNMMVASWNHDMTDAQRRVFQKAYFAAAAANRHMDKDQQHQVAMQAAKDAVAAQSDTQR